MKKAFYVFLLSSLFTFTSCNNEIDTPIKLQGFVFGTTYNIIYYDVAVNFEDDINQLFDEVINLLQLTCIHQIYRELIEEKKV